ncbi:MAG: RHS repeat-associated core domain-containing protein [Minicystis sp.]
MATSPVPDMAAPPGMCPGVAVLGGGGAGGDGDGDGDGGDGKAGGNGNGNGKNGKGGGKNGKGCGSGSGGGCPNPKHGGKGTSAGDPVDISSGRVYTLSVVDLELPGPLHFALYRTYDSTKRDRDVGLGYGWSHSLAWQVDVGRRRMHVTNGLGNTWELPLPAIDGHAHVATMKVTSERGAFTVIDGVTGLTYRFEPASPAATDVARPTGRYALVSIRDAYGNSIYLYYSHGRLDGMLDSAGRRIRVRWSGAHITAFEVHDSASAWVSYRTYEHDDRGDLVAARDGYGHATLHTYDAEHLLTSQRTPEGRTTFYRYDRHARCIETWVERAGGDASLDETVSPFLADRATRAKGVLHTKVEYADDYVEVITSRGVRRYFFEGGLPTKTVFADGVHESNYDALGNLVEYVDGLGARWAWTYDEAGQVTSQRDPLGHLMQWVLDGRGQVVREIRPDGTPVDYVRDAAGAPVEARDPLGIIVAYQRDARGLVTRGEGPDGAITVMAYDPMGNRVYIREPNGGERRITYDALGLITRYVDELGYETRFVYGANRELKASFDPNGGVTELGYDRDGNLTSIVGPQGRYDLFWGGYNSVYRIQRGDGSTVEFRYDREGDLVRVINPAGESHVLMRDAEGRVVGERTFDGRERRFKTDAHGRITRMSEGAEHMEVKYDLLGRIVERVLPDEAIEAFTYDWAGNLLSADNGSVTCTYERDIRGRIVREAQIIGGKTETVESSFGHGGRVGMRTSRGYEEHAQLNAIGAPLELALAGAPAPLRFSYDLKGVEVERVLPGGAVLRKAFDALGRLSRRSLHDPSVHERPADEPQWVGRLPGLVLEQLYEYVADSFRPSRIDSTARGVIAFAYDALGQICERAPAGMPSEKFSYKADGSVLDAAPRDYAPGGRLLRRGSATYRYDDAGRLVEKQLQADGAAATWRYEWNSKGLLSAAISSDGRRVEHVYDAHARRIEKRVSRGDTMISRVRYVWDGDKLVHEAKQRTEDDGHAVVDERTYAFLPGSLVPIAHRDATINGQRLEMQWVYYVSEAAGRPELLVDDRARPLGMFDPKAFGALVPLGAPGSVSTSARFAGHWEDEETGLFYNRWRFFDPETGLYLSPEPVGIEGGLHPYCYALNRPLDAFDPDGLMICAGTPGIPAAVNNQNDLGNENGGTPLNPIVQANLANPPVNGPMNPAGCAEPRYLSDHLNNYRPPITRENDPRLKGALNDFKATAYDETRNFEKRSPCPNCSQLFANLMSKYGAPNPNNIGAGAATAGGVQPPVNFTPPTGGKPGWASYSDALAYYAANNPGPPAG